MSQSHAVEVVCLAVFSTLISLWGLAGGPWLSDHEAIVAQGARQMLCGEGWLIPHVGVTPFVRKPPLAFWLTALSSLAIDPADKGLPVNSFSARLPSGCAAVLTTILVYFLGRQMYGHSTGLICGLIMTSAVGTLFFSHNAQVEMVLTFLCTACFATFWFATEGTSRNRLFLALFYVSLGLAMLAKAPFPLAVVCLPLAAWWFITRPALELNHFGAGSAPGGFFQGVKKQFFRLRELHPVAGALLLVAIVLPWPFYVYSHVSNALDLWNLEFKARYTGALYGTNNPFWYYLLIAAGFMAPYSLSLPAAFASPFRAIHHREKRPLLYALTWVAITTAFLSTSAFKAPRYWIVCVPGAALLLGPTIYRFFIAVREFHAISLCLAKGALLALLCLGTIGGAVWVSRNESAMFYRVAAITLAGGIAATLAFQPGRRLLSLFILQATVAIAFCLGWDVLGLGNVTQSKYEDLVRELNANGIKHEDRITWIQGHPDARLMFYSDRKIGPLFDDSEIGVSCREGRQSVSDAMMAEGLERIRGRLAGDVVEYFIVGTGWWERFQDTHPLPAREVFRVRGSNDSGSDGLVVFTNSWNRGLAEELRDTPLKPDAATAFRGPSN